MRLIDNLGDIRAFDIERLVGPFVTMILTRQLGFLAIANFLASAWAGVVIKFVHHFTPSVHRSFAS
jgi:hypothetical protein